MNRFFRNLLLLLTVVFASCSDRQSEPDFPAEGEDTFIGPHVSIVMGAETSRLQAGDITLAIQAPDGSIISRTARHRRDGDTSTITMGRGLTEGTYRLLSATYPNHDSNPDYVAEFPYAEFGLGSRIEVTGDGIKVTDPYNPTLGYAGRGTKESPYIVSSGSHIFNLMMTVNDYDSNTDITPSTYFEQVCDIDMKQMSRSCDMEYGWLPIGSDTNTPFRGVYLGNGYKITNLLINRPKSSGLGLFGYLLDATIDGVHMVNCSVTGEFAVGTVAGAVIDTGGSHRSKATFTNCVAENCTVQGDATSSALGGILGAIDMHATALLAGCAADGGKLDGGMNIGGIMGGGGLYSSVMISGCRNSASVTSRYSGAGGMVGTTDTLSMTGCTNTARITGATDMGKTSVGIGTGGMVGGAGMSAFTGCVNTGEVSGYEGVGGIIGSTRVRGSADEAYIYNQATVRYCANKGAVSGENFVGGLGGEAQFGSYGVINTAPVTARSYVGGICGSSSVGVIHNSVNTGTVSGERYVAGVLGKTTWGSLAICQNMGAVSGSAGNTGGVLALAGNNTVVHYCSNFGDVTGPSNHPVGGLIAEIGDPREWTAMNIAECVVGSMEIVMAFAGPALAVVETAVEMAEAVEILIQITETTVELSLQASDYVLYGFGLDELISPETEEEISAMIESEAREATAEVTDLLRTARANCGGETAGFPSTLLTENYASSINALTDYCADEANDEIFNEAINEAREERAEALEKVARQKEIIHTVIAGCAIATSTVAFIAGEIVTGGAATVVMMVGASAAFIGGANAVIKTCTEFEHNAVVVSQCLNAGNVNANRGSSSGSLIGHMDDGCLVTDCLNTAPTGGCGSYFIGKEGSHSEVTRLIGVADTPDEELLSGNYKVVSNSAHSTGYQHLYGTNIMVSPDMLSDKELFARSGYSVGTSGHWEIPAQSTFPLPHRSQMQK